MRIHTNLLIALIIAISIFAGALVLANAWRQNSKDISDRQKLEIQREIDRKNEETKQKQDAQFQKDLDLDFCLADVAKQYETNWNVQCKTSGVDKKSSGCRLYNEDSKQIEAWRKEGESNCYKRYN